MPAKRLYFCLFMALCAIPMAGCEPPVGASCGSSYTVAVTYLPKRLDPRRNQINVYHYMILQLYEPLLSISAGQIDSVFLDTKRTRALSKRFDSYQLCLKPGVLFGDGTPVYVEDLARSLRDTHAEQEMLPPLQDMEIVADCVTVQLQRRDADYLDKLTTAASTVLKRGTENDRLPTGVGPYQIADWNDAQIHMVYRGPSRVDFPEIVFQKVRDLDEALDAGLMDLNLMYWEPQRHAVLARWPKLHHSILRSYALIVSTPDAALRQQFTACFDREAYLKNAMSLDLVPSPGFLPVKAPGGDVDFSAIRARMPHKPCNIAGPKPVMRYVNQVYPDSSALRQFFAAANPNLPVTVQVEDRSRADLIEMFSAQEIMLYTIGIDSVNSQAAQLGESSVFFESLVRDHGYLPTHLPEVESAITTALQSSDRGEKSVAYKKAHTQLLESGYIIPLGQLPPTLYYPTCIKQVEFADALIGYPRVDWLVRHKRGWFR